MPTIPRSLLPLTALWILLSLQACHVHGRKERDSADGEGEEVDEAVISSNEFSNGKNNFGYTSDEARLLSVIFERYKKFKKLARPVLNASSTMDVHFGISLIQILDFDEKNQMLATLVWKKYQWRDEILRWDPKAYGDVQEVRLPAERIWTPDIILYSNVGSPDVERHKDLMVVSSDGLVVWVPPVKYQSSCVIDMTDFPFDVQECELRFGSWSYHVVQLNPIFIDQREGIILDAYVPNSEWEIYGSPGQKNVIKYPCCEHPFADLTYKLQLKRKVTFHLRLILVPTMLLSVMSLAIFWMPPTRPDRTAIGLSLFSSFFLLLILIVNSSPATEDARLGQYYIVIILMVSFGIIISVFNINIVLCTRKVPACIDKVFVQWLGCILCSNTNKKAGERKKRRRDGEDGQQKPRENGRDSRSNQDQTRERNPREDRAAREAKAKAKQAAAMAANTEKWKTFAFVLDRIFFLIFLFALVFAFVTIFPSPMRLFSM